MERATEQGLLNYLIYAPGPAAVFDVNGNIALLEEGPLCNKRLEDLLQHTPVKVDDFVAKAYIPKYRSHIANTQVSPDNDIEVRLRLITKNGIEVPVLMSSMYLLDEEIIVSAIADVSEFEQEIVEAQALREEAVKSSYIDKLTKLYNRDYLEDHLDEIESEADRHNTNTAIIFIDLYRFKQINDRGPKLHASGDKALQDLAKILHSTVTGEDRIIRYGGDEFVIILPNTNGQVKTIVSKINRGIDMYNKDNAAKNGFYIIADMGTAWKKPRESSLTECMGYADAALRKTKDARKPTEVILRP